MVPSDDQGERESAGGAWASGRAGRFAPLESFLSQACRRTIPLASRCARWPQPWRIAPRRSCAMCRRTLPTRSFGDATRQPVRILAHMGDLMSWGVSMAGGGKEWKPEGGDDWNTEVERFFTGLAALDAALAADGAIQGIDRQADSRAAGRRADACRPARDAARHGRRAGAARELRAGRHHCRPRRPRSGSAARRVRRRCQHVDKFIGFHKFHPFQGQRSRAADCCSNPGTAAVRCLWNPWTSPLWSSIVRLPISLVLLAFFTAAGMAAVVRAGAAEIVCRRRRPGQRVGRCRQRRRPRLLRRVPRPSESLLSQRQGHVPRCRAPKVGLVDNVETRAAAWGDFDADGDADLYIGFADPKMPAKVYRNDAKGTKFVDVAKAIGVNLTGVARQPAWIDYDGDGDLDLFAAFRDVPNRLLRNDRGKFVDVTGATGIGDPRKTVSAVWWDFDRDGDLDLFTANQEGEANGLYRQTNGTFEDVAAAMGVAGTPRPKEDGGVGPSVADFDQDGDFDLFVANYGPSALYRNDGGLKFTEVSRERGIDLNGHGVTSGWGDLDNDGLPDLYVAQLHRRPAALSRCAVHQRREGVRRVVAGRDPQARRHARRAVRRLRSGRPARSGADQQRSRRRRPSAAAQHRRDARPVDRGRSDRSQRAPLTRRQRSARLSGGHARSCCRPRWWIPAAATARRARCPCTWASATIGGASVDIEVITIAGGMRHAASSATSIPTTIADDR